MTEKSAWAKLSSSIYHSQQGHEHKEIPYPTKACFLSEPCEYERRRHKLYQEESYPAAPKPNKSIKLPNIVTLQNQRTYDLITLGCLIPTMRPHSDKSSDISQPTSSYIAS
jgi:hypothetical protein